MVVKRAVEMASQSKCFLEALINLGLFTLVQDLFFFGGGGRGRREGGCCVFSNLFSFFLTWGFK